jgi:hypothetical protein
MKRELLNLSVALFMLLFGSCKGRTQQKEKFSIIGTWEMIGKFSIDHYPLNTNEKRECIGDEISFLSDTIIAPKDSCLYGEACSKPDYTAKKIKISDLFKGDEEAKSEENYFKTLLKSMHFQNDSINVITTSCGVPYNSIYILDGEHIAFGWNGYLFWFQRVNVKK